MEEAVIQACLKQMASWAGSRQRCRIEVRLHAAIHTTSDDLAFIDSLIIGQDVTRRWISEAPRFTLRHLLRTMPGRRSARRFVELPADADFSVSRKKPAAHQALADLAPIAGTSRIFMRSTIDPTCQLAALYRYDGETRSIIPDGSIALGLVRRT